MSAISGQTQDVAVDWSALRSAPFNVLYRKYGAKGNGVADDTGAVQSAVNDAASAAQSSGIADVLLPAGFEFNLGQITLASGVRIWAYGALINPILSEINQALFYYGSAGNVLQRFELRGGTFQGTGSEGASTPNEQFIFLADSGCGCSDVLIRDTHTPNWGIAPFYLHNPVRARVIGNTILQYGSGGGTYRNGVNFVVDGAMPARGQMMVAKRNVILGAAAAGIAYVNTGGGTGALSLQLIVTDNICGGTLLGNDISGGIDIEFGGTTVATWSDVVIANNVVQNLAVQGSGGGVAANGATFGIALGGTNSNATLIRSTVANNQVDVSANGVHSVGIGGNLAAGSDVTVGPGNHLNVNGGTGIYSPSWTPYKLGNKYSTGPAQGRATLVAGTVTVNTPEIVAGDNVTLTRVAAAGTVGVIQLGTITAGTSFVINSVQPGTASTLQAADTSIIYWRIDH